MVKRTGPADNARHLGLACGIGAVLLGCGYMAAAGAPARYLIVNVGALVVGLLAFAAVVLAPPVFARARGTILLAIGAALLATALTGDAVEGARRWVVVAGLVVQPSLVLVPLLVAAFAGKRDVPATAAMVMAAAALALQPDRAMAAALAAGAAAVWTTCREPRALVATASATIGVAVTLVRADTLPAVPYVDGILTSAFAVHPVAGAMVWGGALLLLAPALVRSGGAERGAFAGVWLVVIAAAAIGNYPTPVVGYGGSAIIGYLLSLTILAPARRPYGARQRGGATVEPCGTGISERFVAA